MACNGCWERFGFFRKEYGCDNCGFAYCSKCLSSKKAVIPRTNDPKPRPVCFKCWQSLTADPSVLRPGPSASLPPQDPTVQRHPTYSASNRPMDPSDRNRSASTDQDQDHRDLMERLRRLQADTPVYPSGNPHASGHSEISVEDRLAQLKGVDPSLIRQPGSLPPAKDDRTEAEKSRDLMRQMREEAELDNRLFPDAATEIERRLARLRGTEQAPHSPDAGAAADADTTNTISDDSSATAEQVDALLRHAHQEAETEAKAALKLMQKDEAVMEQLHKLKEQTRQESLKDEAIGKELGRFAEGDGDSALEDSDDPDALRIAQMAIEEAELEDRLARSSGQIPDDDPGTEDSGSRKKSKGKQKQKSSEPSSSSADRVDRNQSVNQEYDEEQLPWCCICTADAEVRCSGCLGDLYCRRCYREGHDRQDLKSHKWTAYKKPKKETTI